MARGEFKLNTPSYCKPYLSGENGEGEVNVEPMGDDLMVEHQVRHGYNGGTATERVFLPVNKLVDLLRALGYEVVLPKVVEAASER